MADLRNQRRMAAEVLKCGENRVWMNPDRLDEVEDCIHRVRTDQSQSQERDLQGQDQVRRRPEGKRQEEGTRIQEGNRQRPRPRQGALDGHHQAHP